MWQSTNIVVADDHSENIDINAPIEPPGNEGHTLDSGIDRNAEEGDEGVGTENSENQSEIEKEETSEDKSTAEEATE